MRAQHSAVDYRWEIYGRDEGEKDVKFWVRYIENKPEPNATFIEARNVVAELEGDVLILQDEVILNSRKDWEYDPDHPRNLAKAVTVK